jgi:hypothetical protein
MRKGGKRMSETNTRVKHEDDSMGGERRHGITCAPGAWDGKINFFGHGVKHMVCIPRSLFLFDRRTRAEGMDTRAKLNI